MSVVIPKRNKHKGSLSPYKDQVAYRQGVIDGIAEERSRTVNKICDICREQLMASDGLNPDCSGWDCAVHLFAYQPKEGA